MFVDLPQPVRYHFAGFELSYIGLGVQPPTPELGVL
jgi:ABC-type dipeptide/oligopeptide/nickel transport system permease subunit